MKRIVPPAPDPDSVINVNNAQPYRIVCINIDGAVGVVIRKVDEGIPSFYIQWSDERRSLEFRTFQLLFAGHNKSVEFYQI